MKSKIKFTVIATSFGPSPETQIDLIRLKTFLKTDKFFFLFFSTKKLFLFFSVKYFFLIFEKKNFTPSKKFFFLKNKEETFYSKKQEEKNDPGQKCPLNCLWKLGVCLPARLIIALKIRIQCIKLFSLFDSGVGRRDNKKTVKLTVIVTSAPPPPQTQMKVFRPVMTFWVWNIFVTLNFFQEHIL